MEEPQYVETIWIPERIEDGKLEFESATSVEENADPTDVNSLWRWVKFDRVGPTEPNQ